MITLTGLEAPTLEAPPAVTITEADVAGFAAKLEAWYETLPPGEQAVLQRLLARAEGMGSEDPDVEGYALPGIGARLARIFATGLLGVALAAPLAAPLAASAAVNPALKGIVGVNPGVMAERLPPPTVRVHSPNQLVLTLSDPKFKGRVIVPYDAQWNMSGIAPSIPLRSGVSLIGERGPLGSRPLLYTDYKAEGYTLFEVVGNDVRVEGIHFRGPANGSHSSSQPFVTAIEVVEDPGLQTGRWVVIADNEFDEWTASGVDVHSVYVARLPEGYAPREGEVSYDPSWPRLGHNDAGLVRIERNYFHHNARDGVGYGVHVGSGGYATVEYNVFDFNRHAVTSDGYAHSGYVARFNYVLQGGFTYGSNGYYGQHFDVHGTAGSGGSHDGGLAGEYYQVAFNTIRGEQNYGGFLGISEKTRAAFELRGRPAMGAYFQENVVVHDDRGEAIRLKAGDDSSLDEDSPSTFNFVETRNLYDKDYSLEVASGDFDGDGLTDVFVANGTAWFYSRGGIRPWEFLHASTKRTHELGFADIDNDGITDVLYRDAAGNLGYLKSGTHALVNFTTVPVPMKDLRFGDFDGDGKTDIFYTLGGQWWIWYGSTRTWTTAQSSSLPISELLFGEFDGVSGTDVVAVTSGVWAYSSGGMAPWAKLNNKLARSFAGAVAADFDGNGKSDIAFNDGGTWRYSRDGRAPLAVLRDGDDDGLLKNVPLKSLLVGPFDGGTRAKVVRFEWKFPLFGERLAIWRGPGSGNAFSMRSLQNMR